MDRKKILIIEDDRDFVRLLAMFLRANDYEVIVASDGVAAISETRKSNPDLILLDLGLPAGDGFVVMERLKALPAVAGIPVIVVSARDPAINKEQALKAGAAAYFQKPADNDDLLAAIKQALGEKLLIAD